MACGNDSEEREVGSDHHRDLSSQPAPGLPTVYNCWATRFAKARETVCASQEAVPTSLMAEASTFACTPQTCAAMPMGACTLTGIWFSFTSSRSARTTEAEIGGQTLRPRLTCVRVSASLPKQPRLAADTRPWR